MPVRCGPRFTNARSRREHWRKRYVTYGLGVCAHCCCGRPNNHSWAVVDQFALIRERPQTTACGGPRLGRRPPISAPAHPRNRHRRACCPLASRTTKQALLSSSTDQGGGKRRAGAIFRFCVPAPHSKTVTNGSSLLCLCHFFH